VRTALATVLVALLATAGCRPPEVAPPYAEGQAPAPAVLLGSVAPKISALQVPAARVKVGRAPSGNLMFLAQKPGRFTGQIQIAGHEFVSLAFHELGYTLRNVAADNLPAGFYSGPPADCAIQRLLGVPFDARELVALVLGGAPALPSPYDVVEQHWDARHGHEVLRLRAPGYEQELRFAFVAGAWWPAGGTLWRRQPDGELGRVWTLLHEGLRQVGGTVLPQRTRLAGASTRKQDRVIITYNAQTVDPDLGDSSAAAEDDGGGWEDEDTGAAPQTPASGAPAASDDEGWEDPDPAAKPEPTSETGAPPPGPEPVRGHDGAPKVAPKIPPQFTLDGAGLSPRGDLCR
jgi:hypothetical protein